MSLVNGVDLKILGVSAGVDFKYINCGTEAIGLYSPHHYGVQW